MSKKVVKYTIVSRVPLLRGSWNNGANAGPRALNLNNAPSNRYSHIGFRSALKNCQKHDFYGDHDSAYLNGLYILSRALKYGWFTLFSSDVERWGGRHA